MPTVESVFASYPIARAALFGSRARGDSTDGSDYDYIVEFLPEYTATQYFDFWDELESALGTKVDMLTTEMLMQMPSKFKSKIESELKWVYKEDCKCTKK